jgi:hypothetical protein
VPSATTSAVWFGSWNDTATMVDPVGVEDRGSADDTVNFVTLVQEKLSQVRTVLAGDAGDQRAAHAILDLRVLQASVSGGFIHIIGLRDDRFNQSWGLAVAYLMFPLWQLGEAVGFHSLNQRTSQPA